MSRPYLKAGHEFRDLDGTLVATLARDCYPGEMLAVEQFKFEPGFECKIGEIIHPVILRDVGLYLARVV